MHSITVGRILTVRIWNFSVLRAHTHWNAIHIHNTLMLINYTIYLQNLETQCFKPCLRYFAICMTIITLFNAMWWGTCTCDGKNVQNWYRIVSCQVSMPSRWERGWWSQDPAQTKHNYTAISSLLANQCYYEQNRNNYYSLLTINFTSWFALFTNLFPFTLIPERS